MRDCRSCHAPLEMVLDLGMHRPADFTDPGVPLPEPWPLDLALCPSCGLLQLGTTTPREVMYHERYGFRSGVNEAIRADLADVVRYALDAVAGPARWLDIACNDGTLLSLVPDGVIRSGIDPLCAFPAFRDAMGDPAKAAAPEIIGDYFHSEYFLRGEFDVITSVSMFYDLDDPADFAAGVAKVLAAGGAWVIQQNYALEMIRQNAVDNICHEHVTYFTLSSLIPVLASAGLEVNDMTYSDVNGGCFRTLVSHRGRREVRGSVGEALAAERAAGLADPATWKQWGAGVLAELGKTREFLDEAHAAGRRVLLYGASTRGGTVLQAIGAGPDLLPAAVERNPEKAGKVMAATGIPIISEEEMRASPPDAMLVGPWFFRRIFLDRERAYLDAGGQMVFPLPRFEVVGGSAHGGS